MRAEARSKMSETATETEKTRTEKKDRKAEKKEQQQQCNLIWRLLVAKMHRIFVKMDGN